MAFALRRTTPSKYLLGAVRAVYAYGVRTVGRRFTRFAFGSVVALAASEITLVTCLGVAHAWPTVSAAAAWFAGAVVSYVLSRWAWERKGRPDLLKETLPFWLVAIGTIIVLSAATSLAHHLALSMGLRPVPRLAFVGAVYLAANTATFLTRFVVFHYVLFADRHSAAELVSDEAPAAVAIPSPARPADPAAAAISDPAGPSRDAAPRSSARAVSRPDDDRCPE